MAKQVEFKCCILCVSFFVCSFCAWRKSRKQAVESLSSFKKSAQRQQISSSCRGSFTEVLKLHSCVLLWLFICCSRTELFLIKTLRMGGVASLFIRICLVGKADDIRPKKENKIECERTWEMFVNDFFSVSVMVCWSVIMNQIKRNKNSHSQRCEITLTFFSSLLNRNRLLSYHSGSAMICLEIFRPDVIDNELNQTNYQLIPIEINESNNKLRRRHSHRSLKQRSQTNTIFVFLCVRE